MQPQDGLPPPQRRRALLVIILGLLVAVLDGTVVNLALPGIAHDLRASASQSIWVVNAYQVATLALLLPLATLGDLVGYRRVYLWGLALFTVASLGCALAGSVPTLALARAVQGLGAAGIMSVNAALVRQIFPRALLGRGMAINSMVVATATVAGPSVAALILSVAPWPWLFALNLPLGVLTLALGLRALPHAPGRRLPGERLSAIDVTLNILMFSLVFLAVDMLGTRRATLGGAPLPTGLTVLAAGIAIGVVYVRRQLRQPLPLFPLDLLRIPVFALSMCTSVAAFSAQMLAFVALPFLMLDHFGRTPFQAGMLITAWPLAIVVVAPVAGRMIGRFPSGLLGGIGLGVMATGLVAMALLPAHPGDADMVWRLLLCGAGFGLFQSPNNHTIVTSAPLARSGGASGMLGTARLTGQTLGAVVLAMIFSVWSPHDGRGAFIALGLAGGLAAVAGVLSTLRLRTSVPVHP